MTAIQTHAFIQFNEPSMHEHKHYQLITSKENYKKYILLISIMTHSKKNQYIIGHFDAWQSFIRRQAVTLKTEKFQLLMFSDKTTKNAFSYRPRE